MSAAISTVGITSSPARPEIAADGNIKSVGNGGNDMYQVTPRDCLTCESGTSTPPRMWNTGRVAIRLPETSVPSASTTVSILAQSLSRSGGWIAAWPWSHASA